MPKIVSLNKQSTESPHRVSFNLDSVPSEGVVGSLYFGVAKVWNDGSVLHVQVPEDGAEFSSRSLRTLQDKLNEAQEAYDHEVQRREERLARIAANLGLPAQ